MASERLLARPFTVESMDDEGSFKGHGAVFGDIHPTSSYRLAMSGADWQDRVMPGAFTKTLETHAKAGTMPAMLYMHERGNVVGAWRSLSENNQSLNTNGQVSKWAKTPNGAGIHELMKMGALTGLSIGFSVKNETLDDKKKIRDINEIELNELSIVDVPGIHRARITDVKTALARIDEIERALRDAGLSRRQAKAILADGFKALRDAEPEDDDVAPLPPRDAGTVGAEDNGAELAALLRQFTKSIKL